MFNELTTFDGVDHNHWRLWYDPEWTCWRLKLANRNGWHVQQRELVFANERFSFDKQGKERAMAQAWGVIKEREALGRANETLVVQQLNGEFRHYPHAKARGERVMPVEPTECVYMSE